jgi:HPt (histidine-containing phosphotransfer) domain-containing protein
VLDELGPEVKAQVLRSFVARSSADALTLGAHTFGAQTGGLSSAEVKFLAHRVRGSSLLVGATDLADACARVEAADGADATANAGLRAALEAAVRTIEQELHAHP